ncbi:MAG: OmpH family outer membrane protein [Firmicutes bacterium]|nr:OmpH family outer membrane protein [Bacillota bacterium]
MKERRYLAIFVGLVVLTLVLAGVFVSSAQGQAEQEIGIINMEVIFTEYLAPPLFAARDQMQQEFEEKAEELSDEEKNQLFIDYQAKLETIEIEYSNNIMNAVAKVAKTKGLSMVIDSAAVLHGGLDVTTDILNELAEQK